MLADCVLLYIESVQRRVFECVDYVLSGLSLLRPTMRGVSIKAVLPLIAECRTEDNYHLSYFI